MKYAMNNFIYTVGVFYLPLYDKAVEIVKGVGPVEVRAARLQTKTCKVLVNNYLMINKFYNGQRRLAVKHLG